MMRTWIFDAGVLCARKGRQASSRSSAFRIISFPSGRQHDFAIGIEVNAPPLLIRQIAQVRGLRGAVPEGHIALGEPARAAGIQKILHMLFDQVRVALDNNRRVSSWREELEFGAVD